MFAPLSDSMIVLHARQGYCLKESCHLILRGEAKRVQSFPTTLAAQWVMHAYRTYQQVSNDPPFSARIHQQVMCYLVVILVVCQVPANV